MLLVLMCLVFCFSLTGFYYPYMITVNGSSIGLLKMMNSFGNTEYYSQSFCKQIYKYKNKIKHIFSIVDWVYVINNLEIVCLACLGISILLELISFYREKKTKMISCAIGLYNTLYCKLAFLLILNSIYLKKKFFLLSFRNPINFCLFSFSTL